MRRRKLTYADGNARPNRQRGSPAGWWRRSRMLNPLRILAFLAAERLARNGIAREPEPELVMSSPEQVESFDREGDTHGVLIPVYHLNAVLLSHILPEGGSLLDLGCGSGRLLMHLAERRPDIEIVGLDASEGMIERARTLTRERGLEGRLTFVHGDMLRLHDYIGTRRFSAISSIFALHHLPTHEALAANLASIASRGAPGLHVFDFARPRRRRSAERFPALFSPQASPQCGEDTTNSLLAAFSFGEIRAALGGHQDLASALSKPLPIYQVHRRCPEPEPDTARLWRPASLSAEERALYTLLRRSLRTLRWPAYE